MLVLSSNLTLAVKFDAIFFMRSFFYGLYMFKDIRGLFYVQWSMNHCKMIRFLACIYLLNMSGHCLKCHTFNFEYIKTTRKTRCAIKLKQKSSDWWEIIRISGSVCIGHALETGSPGKENIKWKCSCLLCSIPRSSCTIPF